MSLKTILAQKHSGGRTKFIVLTCEKDTVHRTWGLVDGKVQETDNTYTYINKGKANQLNPEQAAEADYERIKARKIKEGYQEVESLELLKTFKEETPIIDFYTLPSEFCCSKPYTSITERKLEQMFKTGKFFIKENGMCHFILVTPENEIKILTRRLEDHTAKYPKLKASYEALKLPASTLLITELVIDLELELPHLEAFKRMSRISKSDTTGGKVKDDLTKTFDLQEETPVASVIFGVLFYGGQDVTTLEYDTIFTSYILPIALTNERDGIYPPRPVVFNSHKDVLAWVKNNNTVYEGLVFWDMHSNLEISYNGKPNRRACYKIKAQQEDDVVAYAWEEGSGDKQGKIGSLHIGKYNSLGEIVPFGKCGSGLTDELSDPNLWSFPCVVQIDFDQRFPTGAYQFPRINKRHEDKVPSEIVVDENGR